MAPSGQPSETESGANELGEHQIRRRAVFLDRDGVINKSVVREGRPHPPAELRDFELYDDVPSGCARLDAAGYCLVVVTNQPDVARGTQKREVVDAMHRQMLAALPQIARVEVCWHSGTDSGDSCDCRKPKPGMVLHAANELDLDLAQSFLIGDRWRDVDCGHAAGCRTVFIDRNYSEPLRRPPDWTVQSFGQAVDVILLAGAEQRTP
jgi:D-glycero-D-manno-heptose 1,7-bisphosphate phosphatase